MTFDNFLGNQSLKQTLKSALKNRFPQALLLTGPIGSGKMTLAKILAAALLCSESTTPCGTCSSCRKAQNNIHPDLTIIDNGLDTIKVDTARFIRTDCFVMPNDSNRKVYIIRNADKLNVQSQNILLKTLEEPPLFAFFILLAESTNDILPTVLSRVIKYSLSPLADHDITYILKNKFPNISQDEIQVAVKNSNGIAGDAISSFSSDNDNILAIADPFLSALALGDELNMMLSLSKAEKLTRNEFSVFLSTLRISIRDAIFISKGLDIMLIPSLKPQNSRLASNIDSGNLIKLYDFIHTLQSRMDVNPSLSMVSAAICAGSYIICYKN